MTETPRHWTNPWVAFSAGAVAMLALLLAWGAWNRLVDAPHRIQVALGPDLPQIPAPRLPEAPRLPAVPVPAPR
jgi:hypothetical protein